MDSSKFDELTRALASTTSRRQALKTLAASTLGGIFTFSGLGRAFAREKHCERGETNCFGRCVNLKSNPNHCGSCSRFCASGQTCVNGSCTCSQSSDCPPDQVCTNGMCASCPSGLTDCGGVCKNTNTDPNNCGSCNNVCPPTYVCSGGMCVHGL